MGYPDLYLHCEKYCKSYSSTILAITQVRMVVSVKLLSNILFVLFTVCMGITDSLVCFPF